MLMHIIIVVRSGVFAFARRGLGVEPQSRRAARLPFANASQPSAMSGAARRGSSLAVAVDRRGRRGWTNEKEKRANEKKRARRNEDVSEDGISQTS